MKLLDSGSQYGIIEPTVGLVFRQYSWSPFTLRQIVSANPLLILASAEMQ